MIISVTQQHIKQGKPFKASKCPIALALTDAGFMRPMANTDTIIWGDLKRSKSIAVPRSVTRFINRFDAGLLVKPFRFLLNA